MLLVTTDDLSIPLKHQDFLPVNSALLGDAVQVVVVTAAERVSRAREPNNNNTRDNLSQTLLIFFTSFTLTHLYFFITNRTRQPTLITTTMHFLYNKQRREKPLVFPLGFLYFTIPNTIPNTRSLQTTTLQHAFLNLFLLYKLL